MRAAAHSPSLNVDPRGRGPASFLAARRRFARFVSLTRWARDAASRYPAAPAGEAIYAIGDIHGRADCLRRAHALIDQDRIGRAGGRSATEIYIGDYVDRGPDSKGAIDLLVARASVANIVALRGNHEIMMESFLRGLTSFEDWRRFGGLETILSYGVDVRTLLARGAVRPRDLAERVPAAHLRFLASLKAIHTSGRYCFAHAGIRPGVPLEAQSIDDTAWIRDDFLNHPGGAGLVVVHGHSPVSDVEFHANRINIDTGAYLTNRLSVLRIDADGPRLLGPSGT
jgi:serine/threonine protein phosphatase 1